MALFAGMPFFVLTGSLVPGLGEILVAAPAASAFGNQHALAGSGEISDGFAAVLVKDQSAHGDLQEHVGPGMSGAIRALAVTAAIGLEFAVIAVAQQSVIVGIGFQENAAAMAAVAARGSAARDVFFAAKGHATVAAVPGFHKNFGFVDKHSETSPRKKIT